MEFKVEEMTEKPGDEIIEFLADAYLESPLVIAAFSEDKKARLEGNRKLFKVAIDGGILGGTLLRIRNGAKTIGLLHYAASPYCSPPPEAQMKLGLLMSKSLGEAGLRVGEWFMTWSKVHPNGNHWHLGPYAVSRTYRGFGLGEMLMREYCWRMDDANVAGYLETDYPQNVAYYHKFGFLVKLEYQVIGIMNWFMERSPNVLERTSD